MIKKIPKEFIDECLENIYISGTKIPIPCNLKEKIHEYISFIELRNTDDVILYVSRGNSRGNGKYLTILLCYKIIEKFHSSHEDYKVDNQEFFDSYFNSIYSRFNGIKIGGQ